MIIHDSNIVAVYAADALPEAERTDVEAHIYSCDTCLGELDSYRETMASFVPDLPPVTEVWSRIERELMMGGPDDS